MKGYVPLLGFTHPWVFPNECSESATEIPGTIKQDKGCMYGAIVVVLYQEGFFDSAI